MRGKSANQAQSELNPRSVEKNAFHGLWRHSVAGILIVITDSLSNAEAQSSSR